MADVYLYPDGTVSTGIVTPGTWGPTGAATIHEAIDDLQGAPDDNTTYAQGSPAIGTFDAFLCSLSPMVDAIDISQIEMRVRFNNAGAGADQHVDFGIRIGSTNYLNGLVAAASAAYADLTKVWALNPATGAPWTKAQLDDLLILCGMQDNLKPADSVRYTQAHIKVTYQPLPADIGAARALLSSRLRRFRREVEGVTVRAPLELLDVELMDDFSISHFDGPSEDGRGWGTKTWQRRLHNLRAVSYDPNTFTVELQSVGQDEFLCTFWDTAESRLSSSTLLEGVARLTAGGTISYARSGKGWWEDPGSRLIVEGGTDQLPLAYGGMLIVNAETNYLTHSSCKDGAASVAALPAGSGSGTLTAEAAPPSPYFDSGVSGNAYLFTKGSPHTTTQVRPWNTTATIPANTKLRFWFQYMDDAAGVSADRLNWRLQRAVDSRYWNDSTSTWDVAVVDNPAPLSTTRTEFMSKRIPIGGTGTPVTLSWVKPSGGTAAFKTRLYHANLGDNYWWTGPVVTDAATYTRAAQTYKATNASGARSLNGTCGTFEVEAVPAFDAADMNAAGGTPKLLDLTYDASNWIRIYYNASVGNRLDFEIRSAGVTYSTNVAWTPVRGTGAKIVARWFSAEGEHNYTPMSFAISVNNVEGTPGVRVGDPTRSSADLYIGCDASGNAFNGNLRRILLSQQVYSAGQVAAFTP